MRRQNIRFEHEISDPEEIDSLFCSAVDEFDTYFGKLQRHVKDLTEKTTSTDTRARNNLQEKGYPMAVTAVLVRMVTSAIMYGDRRDTAEFTTGNTYGDIAGLWEEDLRFLEDKIAGLIMNRRSIVYGNLFRINAGHSQKRSRGSTG